MSKTIFISSVYENSHLIATIKNWVEKDLLGDVVISHETEDKRHIGDEAIKNHIKDKIRGATILMVLIGNDTHNHNWIKVETELANSFNKKIVCVRIPNTTGERPPILQKHRLIAFEPQILKRMLNE